MRLTLAVSSLLILAASVQAAQQLRIVADTFQGSEKKNYSVFEGNVRIKKGSDELNASRVEVYLDAQRQPLKYVAEGDVSFFLNTKDGATYTGHAQKVIFAPQAQEYHFYKDVHLMQINEHKQIDGDEVVVNVKEGTATAKGAEKQPVIMIFELPDTEKKP